MSTSQWKNRNTGRAYSGVSERANPHRTIRRPSDPNPVISSETGQPEVRVVTTRRPVTQSRKEAPSGIIFESIEILSKEKGIDPQIVINAVKDAMLVAARNSFEPTKTWWRI